MKIRILMACSVLLILATGCATVQPWERESLSDPIMIMDENAIEAGKKEFAISQVVD